MLVDGEVAFLEWRGCSDTCEIKEGADSFLIRNGRIIARTIHYKSKGKGDRVANSYRFCNPTQSKISTPRRLPRHQIPVRLAGALEVTIVGCWWEEEIKH
jgi:hypothetical protein